MSIELSQPGAEFNPEPDRRGRIEEPLPVRLVAVADMRLPTPPGIDALLDRLYVELLGFVRNPGAGVIAYNADNFRLIFDLVDELPVQRAGLRAAGIEVQSLGGTERKLIDAEIEYKRRRGMTPGEEILCLHDPAGNALELVQRREVG